MLNGNFCKCETHKNTFPSNGEKFVLQNMFLDSEEKNLRTAFNKISDLTFYLNLKTLIVPKLSPVSNAI